MWGANARVVRFQRQSTIAQIPQDVNVGSDTGVSEYTVHCSLLHMELHSHRPVRVPMLNSVHCQMYQQLNSMFNLIVKCKHQNWTTEQCKKLAWSDKSCFFGLHHVNGWLRVCRLPGEHMEPGCTIGGRQVGGGSLLGNLGSCHRCGCYLTHTKT